MSAAALLIFDSNCSALSNIPVASAAHADFFVASIRLILCAVFSCSSFPLFRHSANQTELADRGKMSVSNGLKLLELPSIC
jgi:hypothetical protein